MMKLPIMARFALQSALPRKRKSMYNVIYR